jgi:hypothetical protein
MKTPSLRTLGLSTSISVYEMYILYLDLVNDLLAFFLLFFFILYSFLDSLDNIGLVILFNMYYYIIILVFNAIFSNNSVLFLLAAFVKTIRDKKKKSKKKASSNIRVNELFKLKHTLYYKNISIIPNG